MATLHLVLKTKLYDMIESGEKPEEYRQINKYWRKKIGKYCFPSTNKGYDTITFHRGYTDITMTFKINIITVGRGRTDWGAPENEDVYILHLGERLKTFYTYLVSLKEQTVKYCNRIFETKQEAELSAIKNVFIPFRYIIITLFFEEK